MVIIRKKHVETAEEKEARLKHEAEAKSGIQDQYQARGFELVSWIQDHKGVVIALVALLFIGGGAFGAYSYYQQRADETATAKFLVAVKELDAVDKDGNEPADKTAKNAKAQADLQDVANNYSRSRVAVLANIYAGHLALESTDPKAALIAYQNALNEIKKSDALYPLALVGLGYAQERNSDVKAALTSFESVIANKDSMAKDLALFEAARLAALLKENDKAKEYRDRLMKDFPNSVYEKNLMRLAIH